MLSHWRTSYAWGIDQEDGWGGRYYFTFYTTLGSLDYAGITFEVILYVLILLISIMANMAIIIIVLRRKEIQSVTNCFIVNLAVADLIFVLGIPALIISRMHPYWCLGEMACKLLPYSQFVCGSVLLWTLALISIDRLRCLTTSPYYEGIKHNHALIISVMTWMFSIVIHIPVAVFFREQDIQQNATTILYNEPQRYSYARNLSPETKQKIQNTTICTLIFPAGSIDFALMFTVPTTIISCIIPLLILIINYHKIFVQLKNIRKKLEEKAGCLGSCNSKLRESILTIASNLISRNEVKTPLKKVPSSACMHRLEKHKKSVRLLYLNVITVLLMWLPMPIVMFMIYFDGHRYDNNYFLTSCDFRLCVTIALINTIINPIFYGFLTENFKKNIKQWFKSKRKEIVTEDPAEHININVGDRN